jgi:hypothetical protein
MSSAAMWMAVVSVKYANRPVVLRDVRTVEDALDS